MKTGHSYVQSFSFLSVVFSNAPITCPSSTFRRFYSFASFHCIPFYREKLEITSYLVGIMINEIADVIYSISYFSSSFDKKLLSISFLIADLLHCLQIRLLWMMEHTRKQRNFLRSLWDCTHCQVSYYFLYFCRNSNTSYDFSITSSLNIYKVIFILLTNIFPFNYYYCWLLT